MKTHNFLFLREESIKQFFVVKYVFYIFYFRKQKTIIKNNFKIFPTFLLLFGFKHKGQKVD